MAIVDDLGSNVDYVTKARVVPTRMLQARQRMAVFCHAAAADQFRLFHALKSSSTKVDKLFRQVAGAWRPGSKDATPAAVTESLQELRKAVGGNNTAMIQEKLLNVANLINPDTVNPQILRLISRSLDKLMYELPPTSTQSLFRAIVKNDTKGDLSTRLYLKIYKNAKLSRQELLQNGALIFSSLRSRGLIEESRQLLSVLFSNDTEISDELVLDFFSRVKESQPDAESVVKIIKNLVNPSNDIIQAGLLLIVDTDFMISESARQEAAESIVDYILFERPHFKINHDTLVIALDCLLTLDAKTMGQKALHYALAASDTNESKNSLEFNELMLQCCMKFEDKVSVGDSVMKRIATIGSHEYAKETWDVIIQYSFYRSGNIEALTKVLTDMKKANFRPDSRTFSGVLQVANDHAKLDEQKLKSIIDYFNKKLDIPSDAVVFSILINRALRAVEIETARRLFIDSISEGADWQMENGRYLRTLDALLVALCKCPTISFDTVYDTYNRIRICSTTLAYETQTELLKFFLEKGDILKAGVFLVQQFGESPSLPYNEYKDIYHAFYEKILASNEYEKAWELYMVLNCTVVLPYESYYPIQSKFCQLGRPDAAHLMFRHLRNRAKKNEIQPPGHEMYLLLFAEYGRWRYEEGIRELEIYLRMDLNVEMNIELMNLMMGAYAALSESCKLNDLWLEVVSYPIGCGANNRTISIMLRYLGRISLEMVDDLWNEFPQRFHLTPSSQNVEDYVIANCYHGYYSRAFEIVKAAPSLYNVDISQALLKTLYNWTLIQSRKDEIAEWASKNHPEDWKFLIESKSLKKLCLPKNSNNDSEDSVRAQTIQILVNETMPNVPKATKTTEDLD